MIWLRNHRDQSLSQCWLRILQTIIRIVIITIALLINSSKCNNNNHNNNSNNEYHNSSDNDHFHCILWELTWGKALNFCARLALFDSTGKPSFGNVVDLINEDQNASSHTYQNVLQPCMTYSVLAIMTCCIRDLLRGLLGRRSWRWS